MSGQKQKINLEYILNTSPAILFNRLSTPSGLSEWFSDDVNVEGQLYTFIWKGAQQQAHEVARKENRSIRFRWVDDGDEESYFEFKVEVDELTGDTALIVVDFAEADEADDAIELWNRQIEMLKHVLGSH
ncbi:MAG: START-like domain-containing protein [Breznakibacter sp.]